MTAEKITNSNDLNKLAVESRNNLGDREFTQILFEQAENRLMNARDLDSVAEAVKNTIGDQNPVRPTYRKAVVSTDNSSSLQLLFESLRNAADDLDLATELIGTMKRLSEITAEPIETCRAAQVMLDDQESIDSLLKAADESASNPATLNQY